MNKQLLQIQNSLNELARDSNVHPLFRDLGIRKTAGYQYPSGIEDSKISAFVDSCWNAGPLGFKRLAQSLQLPLKVKLDYVSILRKVLLVETLTSGNDFPIFDYDYPQYGAVKISEFGSPPEYTGRLVRLSVPTFVLSSYIPVKYAEINVRRYKIIDRAKERAAISVAVAEDTQLFSLLDAASAVSPNGTITVTNLNKDAIAVALGKIWAQQLEPKTLILHPLQLTDLLRLGSDKLDPVTLNTTIETGTFGQFMGLNIIVTPLCPQGSSYMVTTKDKLGRLAERQTVEVKIFDNVPKTEYDIMAWEQIGLIIHNLAGIQKINVTGSGTV